MGGTKLIFKTKVYNTNERIIYLDKSETYIIGNNNIIVRNAEFLSETSVAWII